MRCVPISIENDYNYNHLVQSDIYAHVSTGILTRHHLFLLWFEIEMQILLKDPSFILKYWKDSC